MYNYNINIVIIHKTQINVQSISEMQYLCIKECERNVSYNREKDKELLYLYYEEKTMYFYLEFYFSFVFLCYVFVSIYQTVEDSIFKIEEIYGTSFRIQIYRDESKPEFWEEK